LAPFSETTSWSPAGVNETCTAPAVADESGRVAPLSEWRPSRVA
jgi:hypothetical protein